MGIEGYEWAIYGLSILSVMMIGHFLFLEPTDKFKSAYSIGKIVCLAVFLFSSMYWIITFPHVGWAHNFSENENSYSKLTDVEGVKSDIEKNSRRIKILERELEQSQSDLEAVGGRIKLFLQIAMFGLIYGSVGLGVRLFRKDKAENENSLDL
ncbi:MAG: hypothetical protein KIS76_04885 [Pyrinomonadaceae bacterium]|nr:hypothetical protein [Pyrinomonadaceae bacterium]